MHSGPCAIWQSQKIEELNQQRSVSLSVDGGFADEVANGLADQGYGNENLSTQAETLVNAYIEARYANADGGPLELGRLKNAILRGDPDLTDTISRLRPKAVIDEPNAPDTGGGAGRDA